MLLGQVISSLSHLSSYCLSVLNGIPASFLELYSSFWWVDNYLEGYKCSWHHPNWQDYRLRFTWTSQSNHILFQWWIRDRQKPGLISRLISRLMAFPPTCDANWARFRQHSVMVKQELKETFSSSWWKTSSRQRHKCVELFLYSSRKHLLGASWMLVPEWEQNLAHEFLILAVIE